MRLINVETKHLENFYGDPDVPYAILSHTWGREEEELSFQDLRNLDQHGAGRRAKLDRTCSQAKKDGIKYAWIDTCCIDKTNAVELSEAITSMFRWYKKSAMCYTHLSDVKKGAGTGQIRNSRWFTRGWTLQELLASPKMTFFDSLWRELGTKSSLSGVIIEATGIPHHILSGFASLDSASIAQKFSWVSRRKTTRPEDMAYCLFGIFDLAIPPLYGEGLELAFERLQEAIMRKSPDDSILAWDALFEGDPDSNQTLPALSGGVLAGSPASFATSGDIVQRGQADTRIRASETAWGTIPISICLTSDSSSSNGGQESISYGYLSCGPKHDPALVVAIPLIRCPQDTSNSHGPPVYLRPRGSKAVCLPKPAVDIAPKTILIRKNRAQDQIRADDKSYWFYLPGPYPYNGAIEEVYPANSYVKELAMITTPRESQTESQLFLARFCCTEPEMDTVDTEVARLRFILVLQFFADSARGKREPCANLYFDKAAGGAPTPLSEIADMWPSLSHTRSTSLHLGNNHPLSINVRIGVDTIAGHRLWAVNLLPHKAGSTEALDIPPLWPNVSEQMMLRRRGMNLVEALRDRARLSREYVALRERESMIQQERMELEKDRNSLQEEIKKLMGMVAERDQQLEMVLRDAKRCAQKLREHDEESQTCASALSTVFSDRAMGRVLSTKSIEAPPQGVINPAGWVEATRRERNGILAHIMQKAPLFNEGKELPWIPGMTLLMYAAATGDRELVETTLDYDDDVEADDFVGMTVFDWAKLAAGDPSDVIALLNAQKGRKPQSKEQKPLTVGRSGKARRREESPRRMSSSAASPAYIHRRRPESRAESDTRKPPAQRHRNRESVEIDPNAMSEGVPMSAARATPPNLAEQEKWRHPDTF